MAKYLRMYTVGEMLKIEFLEPYKLPVEEIAKSISLPVWQITAIIEDGTPMTTEVDLLLTKYFGMSEGFFMRWQEDYNLRKAKKQLHKKLMQIVPIAKLNKAAVL
ncbi:MAG: HigA family addiction module antitoxin [Chitinispirillia bacterium]|nr:HigA family addiction module antitoxin [Chitinispirillia bacterium]MCL2242672.1 HigA family addiction module antitoxin [Chitinispirillia bacterium]